ncbi:MAG: DNA internalization-related competence protein ComEC/Rec2 [Piscirickettsiaceae bacterium]|nr:DNA internalization-related competence protein ComEC/Rec2 [Piscirickettsiaceae bacterium]
MIKTAISFALGCLFFLQLPEMPSVQWLWALFPVCILLFYPYLRWLAVVFLAALWTLFQTNLLLDNRLDDALVGLDLVISGTISNIPEHQSRLIRFEFSPDKSNTITLPNKLRLNWYQSQAIQLHAGEKWQLTVRLKQPRGMSNPGSFDYEGWLFQQGIGATGYVRSSADNKLLESSSIYSINAIRQSLTKAIEQHLINSPHIGLIQGLATGVRHNINQQQWQVLRLSGTSHLLAISGLHIGLSAAIGFFIFRFLWSRRAANLLFLPAKEAGAIGGFILALFYAALAGFSIPSQRAMIMVATVMISLFIRRPIPASRLLAISLLIIVALNPLSVLSAGFWLSFSAVSIILFISQNRFPSPRWQWAKIHTLIAIGLTPLLLLFFMQTSLIAPIANFVAVPVVSLLVVPIILLASFLLWFAEPIAVLLLQLAEQILNLVWFFLDYLAELPYSHWNSTVIPRLYYIPIIIGTLLLLTPRKFPAKWLGIIGFSPLFFYNAQQPNENEFWFTLLDVGQGLSAVIQTQHHTLVFDTGPKFSNSFNTGTAIVLPFLQHQGIKQVDSLIISHGDNDHIGGAIPLINAIDVTQILTSVPELLSNSNHCDAGQSWQWDGVNFMMLNPNRDDISSKNNLSCVLKVSNKTHSVLLTGDIEYATEQQLIARYKAHLPATVLIAPHHGSKTSSSNAFINAVQAQYVLFPVGYNNRYHFPAKRITDRYQQRDITMFNSAKHGAIQFKFDHQNEPQITTWRQSSAKIWRY